MLKELSSGKDFAKQYVAGLPKRTELLESISKSSPTSLTLATSPPPLSTSTPSTSTRLNNVINTDIGELDNETTTKMQKRGFGNKNTQTLTIGSALPNDEFEQNKLLNKRSAFNAWKNLQTKNIING